jgi:hypothetical protein
VVSTPHSSPVRTLVTKLSFLSEPLRSWRAWRLVWFRGRNFTVSQQSEGAKQDRDISYRRVRHADVFTTRHLINQSKCFARSPCFYLLFDWKFCPTNVVHFSNTTTILNLTVLLSLLPQKFARPSCWYCLCQEVSKFWYLQWWDVCTISCYNVCIPARPAVRAVSRSVAERGVGAAAGGGRPRQVQALRDLEPVFRRQMFIPSLIKARQQRAATSNTCRTVCTQSNRENEPGQC